MSRSRHRTHHRLRVVPMISHIFVPFPREIVDQSKLVRTRAGNRAQRLRGIERYNMSSATLSRDVSLVTWSHCQLAVKVDDAVERWETSVRPVRDMPSRRHVFAMRAHALYSWNSYLLLLLPRLRHEIRSIFFLFFLGPDCRALVTRCTGNRILRARRLLVDSSNVMRGMHVRNAHRSNLFASSAARVSLWYVAWAVYQRGPRWRRLLPARWKTLREAGIPGLIVGFVNFRL